MSSLVQALSDAQNELLTLLRSDGICMAPTSNIPTVKNSGWSKSISRSPNRSPSRRPSRPFFAPSNSRRSRSPMQTSGNCGRIKSLSCLDPQFRSNMTMKTSSFSNPPVSFGMNLHFDNVQRGKSPPVGCRGPAGRYHPMTLNQRGITPHGMEYLSGVHGERQHHCSATRFADLLEAETYQLKERRLAEESVTAFRSRPSWY